MISKAKHIIKQVLWMHRMKINGCIIEKGAFVDQSCSIEGKNRFSIGTKLFNSVIGRGTYFNTGTEFHNAIIGRYCSIGSNVKVITGRHPTSKFVSTHPAFFSIAKQACIFQRN